MLPRHAASSDDRGDEPGWFWLLAWPHAAMTVTNPPLQTLQGHVTTALARVDAGDYFSGEQARATAC